MRCFSLFTLCAAAALAACGNDDSEPAPAPATVSLSGTAAIGTPLVGATVSAHCAGSTPVAPAATDAGGQWTLTLASAAELPCALQVSGGSVGDVANTQLLHSYATVAGVVNLTPITDLAVALAAAAVPADWFGALDGTHPPALGAALDEARTQVLAAVAEAGYTLPEGSGFDPFGAAFEASAGDPYDALLDAFAQGVAASGTSYSQLLNDVLAAASAGHGISVPSVGIDVPGTPEGGQTGPIVLVAKGSTQPADIAPLVGHYTGTLGSTVATGQPAVPSDSCSIDVTADGRMSVSAGDRTLGAPVNGDVGDLILTINTIAKAVAFDFASGVNVTVEVVRGYVALATATDASGAVNCTLPNPHVTSAGSTTVQQLNGATAADIDASLVGTYSGDSCAVTVSADGTIHLVSGSVDVLGTLGGDEQDVTTVFATTGVEVMQTEDLAADGHVTQMSFSHTAANPDIGLPVQYRADARIIEPRPAQPLASCSGLVKQ